MTVHPKKTASIALAATGLAIGAACVFLVLGRSHNTEIPARTDRSVVGLTGLTSKDLDRQPHEHNSPPESPDQITIDGHVVDVSAYSALPMEARERDLAKLRSVFAEAVGGLKRNAYALPAEINTSTVSDLGSGKLDVSTGDREPVPVFVVPDLEEIEAATGTGLSAPLDELAVQIGPTASMLAFELPTGTESYRLGHRPSSAFAFVPRRNERWPVADMPYVTGSDEDVRGIEDELQKESSLRSYERRRSFLINRFMAVVQTERVDAVPIRSVYIAFADGRPLGDVVTGAYYEPSAGATLIPWPDSPRDVDPSPDHSIVDPVSTPRLPIRSGGTVGGQTRAAFDMALFRELDGVVYVVASEDWEPFRGRYVLRGREGIKSDDRVRAVYISPHYLP